MKYSELRKSARQKIKPEIKPDDSITAPEVIVLPPPPKSPPENLKNTLEKLKTSYADQVQENQLLNDIESQVILKYNGLKELYKDLDDPNTVVPKRDEIKMSLGELLVAEERIKFNESLLVVEKKIVKYKDIIDSLIQICESLLRLEEVVKS